MNLLFVHQNFPGQYAHLARHFAQRSGNRVAAIVNEANHRPARVPPGVAVTPYRVTRAASPQTHHYLRGLENHVRAGQEAARAAMTLRAQGFKPDAICAHPGWGESLYLKDVFPDAPLLSYWEFFYRAEGSDVGFDPEFPSKLDDRLRVRTKNATQLLALEAADWGVSPTRWQHAQYPAWARERISVIHEEIDTATLTPQADAVFKLPDGRTLSAADEVVTFVSRNLEPYRGFHIFMRALPEILRRRPAAQIVIVGGDAVSYGQQLPAGETWRARMLTELGDRIDQSRLHFTGHVSYEDFVAALRVSTVHVYLTYPFVLSWSLLEAMSLGCFIVGSDTPPVAEAIADGVDGRLVDFFDSAALAEAVSRALADRPGQAGMRAQARASAAARYDLKTICLPAQIALVEELAGGRKPAPGVQ